MSTIEERLTEIGHWLAQHEAERPERALEALILQMDKAELSEWSPDIEHAIQQFHHKRKRNLLKILESKTSGRDPGTVPDRDAPSTSSTAREPAPNHTALAADFRQALDALHEQHIFQWSTFYRDCLTEYLGQFLDGMRHGPLDSGGRSLSAPLVDHARDVFSQGYVFTRGKHDHDEAIRPAPGLRRIDYAAPHLVSPSVSPHVYLETRHGTIEIELAVLDAPLATESLMTLGRDGYYNGLTFHRVERHQAVYAGEPRGDGAGGPGYTLRDEVSQRPFLRGTVGVARETPDAGGSSFFITLTPQPQRDGRYTVIGTVVSGIEVVEALEEGDRIDRLLVWDGVQPFRNAETAPVP